eukprot:22666-Pelagomonas_calceolata.AAC.2
MSLDSSDSDSRRALKQLDVIESFKKRRPLNSPQNTLRVPQLRPEGALIWSSLDPSSSCIFTAPRRRPQQSHGAKAESQMLMHTCSARQPHLAHKSTNCQTAILTSPCNFTCCTVTRLGV